VISDGYAKIKDLGSTNGTFLGSVQIDEVPLTSGQLFRLGGVEMAFFCDSTPETAAAIPPPSTLSVEPPPPESAKPSPTPIARVRPAGLRLSGATTASATTNEAEPPVAPPIMPPIPTGPRFCKFHPKAPAHHLCRKCNRSFCDLCVVSRPGQDGVKKICRTCGVECIPLETRRARPSAPKGFFARIPGAVIYPFRGTGLLILIFGTLVFAGLSFISMGWISIFTKVIALGYLFMYMQNIIHSTAAEEPQMPELPGMDGIFGAFFTFIGTILMSFGLAVGLAVAKFMFDVELIPMSAIMVAVIFGCLYFPMAFLAAAIKDTALAGNPLIVIPSILKVPLEYLVTVVVLTGVFGIQKLGDLVAGGAGSAVFTSHSMSVLFIALGFAACWSFISVYLITVNMRILGLLYLTKKQKLNWR
jgi:hypothetical protein